jgi:hypothetical protein
MSDGEGFALRVTLGNLRSFAPLLKTKRVAEPEGGTGTEGSNEQSTDAANQDVAEDPKLAAAEALFGGKSIKTGIRFSRRPRRPSGSAGVAAGGGSGEGQPPSPASDEVLLMRVMPRRNGTQVQMSMKVLQSAFMNDTTEVLSAADGSRRRIGYDYVTRVKKGTKKKNRVKNTARFEAPELKSVKNPVVRFRWVDVGDSKGGVAKVLEYEVFDSGNSPEGKRILSKLKKGIATPPSIARGQLSQKETVLSIANRKHAQWYRLESVAT